MSIRLRGGPFSGETVEWDTEASVVLVERDSDDEDGELRVAREVCDAWYVRINAEEAIYQGFEAPDPHE